MAPSELHLKSIQFGLAIWLLTSGRSDTARLPSLRQKKRRSFHPRPLECLLRMQATMWEIWIPWKCPGRKPKLATLSDTWKKYSTSSSSSSHWKSGTQTRSGRRLSNTLVSAFIWLQPQGRTINLSCNPNKIIFTHCRKPTGFGEICSAAIDKQNTFFYLKAKEEKLGHRSAFFTLLCTSLLFFPHL